MGLSEAGIQEEALIFHETFIYTSYISIYYTSHSRLEELMMRKTSKNNLFQCREPCGKASPEVGFLYVEAGS